MKADQGLRGAIREVVLDGFNQLNSWRPASTEGLKLNAELAAQCCERMQVALPEGPYPMPYEDFEASVIRSGARPDAVVVTSGELLPEVCSGGGPILAIPAELAADWNGTDTGDYERACSGMQDKQPTEYGGIGWVAVGGGVALVLDLELLTTVIESPDEVVIVRNYECDPEPAAIEELVNKIKESDWREFPKPLELQQGKLVLFDAAYPGAADPLQIEADDGVAVATCNPGEYVIQFATGDGWFDVIRLQRRS